MPRLDGPVEILEKVGPNAHKVDLPDEYGVSATFNVADLSPYFEEIKKSQVWGQTPTHSEGMMGTIQPNLS